MANVRTGIACFALCLTWACGSATDPGLAGSNGSNGTNGTQVTACEDNSECPLSAPICGDDGTCQGCDESDQCRSAGGGDICSTDGPTAGTCVFCAIDTDCGDPAQPLCEAETGTCRGCIDNDECASGICDTSRSQCIDEEDVIYVDGNAPADLPGSQCRRNMPCQRLTFAASVAEGARHYIRIIPGLTYNEDVLLEPGEPLDGPLYINAEDVVFDWIGLEFSLVETEVEEGVIIEGGEWLNAPGPAFNCATDALTLRGVTIRGSGSGVFAVCDEVTVVDSVIEGSTNDAAIVSSLAHTVIERNFLGGNRRGAFRIDGAPRLLLRNNIVVATSKSNNAPPAFFLIANAAEAQSAWQIVHNTIFDTFNNNPESAVVDCGNLFGTLVFVSNIVFNTKGAPPIRGCGEPDNEDPGIRVNFDNILEPVEGFTVGNTNQSEPPVFEDPPSQDFSLQSNSPGVDDADLSNSPPDDFNGRPRFLGSAPDIGAIESQ